MITEKMNRKEVALHLLKNWKPKEGPLAVKNLTLTKKLDKAGLRTHTYDYLLPNNITLTTYIYVHKKPENCMYTFGTWFQTDKGVCFACIGPTYNVDFFTLHFFKRYALRELKNESLSVKEIAKRYFCRQTPAANVLVEEIADGIYEIVSNEGDSIKLGYEDKNLNIRVFNTYISKDLLRDDQKEMVELQKLYIGQSR